jgi:RHH-type proline utilization regulon transcriptional repressor/proline dehydrogenase/delta 1-pyrroline-5-carboxylate dehydrogenase
LATDVGPVIDDEAAATLRRQIGAWNSAAPDRPRRLAGGRACRCHRPGGLRNPNAGRVREEIFGPVLQVVRWSGPVDALVEQINALGYGLTSACRPASTPARKPSPSRPTSATLRQPQHDRRGGRRAALRRRGLSGTGPKAGGPHYLPRFCAEYSVSINTTAAGGDVDLLMAAPH